MKGEGKLTKSKAVIAIALFLMLTMTSLMANTPMTNAAEAEINTFLDIMVSPNPVGVGQELLVTFQLDKLSPTATGLSGGTHFTGFTVKITDPDGIVETKGPYEATAISGASFSYTPAKVGKYTLQASFPGQWVNGTSMGVPYQNYYKPSTSGVLELTVQEEPILEWPNIPLPTDYWTRPINAENKGWWQVSDNWLMKGYNIMTRPFPGSPAFAPYTSAPESAHILWKKPLWFGGMAGGPYGDKSYYAGLSYEQPYEPMILEGRIIYVEHGPSGMETYGTHCISLYTGEEIWYLNNIAIDFCQIYDIENPNEHGLIAHLWERSGSATNTTLKMYDGFTGRYILTITNVTFGMGQSMYWGPAIFGPSGEILSYSLNTAQRRLILWNSTKVITEAFPWMGAFVGEVYSPAVGAVIDGQRGIQWNVSIPATPGMVPSVWQINEGGDTMLAVFTDLSTRERAVFSHIAYSLKPGSEGQVLWYQNRTNIEGMYARVSRNIRDGVYTQYDEALKKFHGYDIKTGNELWVTEALPAGWSIFTRNYVLAYNKLYSVGYDGIVRAFDIKDGSIVWETYLGSSGYETHYGTWPTYAGPVIADNKIYLTNDDHSPDSVTWRGGKLWVFDTTTGNSVWNISGWFRVPAIADGCLTAVNSLDGQIYVFGKGPSATTVTAPDIQVTLGETVMIRGSVLDQSPGSEGTPCVSEESMSAWMEYLHMQKPCPTDVTGVEVKIDVLDANGNYRNVGTATSDSAGNFGFAFEPDIPGKYQISATFEGSESYGSSYGTTYMNVVEAPAATAAPTPEPASLADQYFMPLSIGMIAAIAIVGVVLALLLRKR